MSLTDIQMEAMATIYKKGAALDIEVWTDGLERSPSFTLGYCHQEIIDAISKGYQLGREDAERERRMDDEELWSMDDIPPQDPE